MLIELRDSKKAKFHHLSSSKGKIIWEVISDDEKKAGLGLMAVNDPAERTFGSLTCQLQKYGRISLTSAAAMDQEKRNNYFTRNIDSSTGSIEGNYHKLSKEFQDELISISINDAANGAK